MNVTKPFSVVIMGDLGAEIQLSQSSKMINTLTKVLREFGRQVTVHHCGGSSADIVAHGYAVNAGWRVEAHPACKAAGMIPLQTAAFGIKPEVIHPARTREDRDMEIIRLSRLVLVVESDWGMTTGLVRKGKPEGGRSSTSSGRN